MTTYARHKALFATISLPALLAGIAAPAPAAAGGVSAGTLIENTAVASYDEAGTPRTINSNTVIVRVDELLDVTIASLDPGPVNARAGDAVLSFELTNQSNGPEAFRLTANPAVAGNQFDVNVTGIAIDSNGNGTYEPGIDLTLPAPETTEVLAADGVRTIFVLVRVPSGVTEAQTSAVELTAEAVTGSGAPGTLFAQV